MATSHCDFCGETLAAAGRIERRVAGRRQAFCCAGCALIAEQLALVAPAPQGAPAAARAQACVRIEVRGMVCASCAAWLERRLRALPGVASASVDFVGRHAFVVHDPARVPLEQLRARIEHSGYRAPGGTDPAAERRAQRVELLRVLIAWLAMMQVMMLAAPAYLAGPGELAADLAQLLRIAQLVLCVPVALFCAAPFWRAAASQLRLRRVGMDVPVALGLAGALGASAAATLAAKGAVYFDSATMFVALLLSIRWWQARALGRSAARIDAAGLGAGLRAQRLREGTVHYETVAASRLQPGDRILVAPGEIFPADGRVVEGAASVSQAWLTGEAAPVDRIEGDPVLAGGVNVGQAVILRVTRSGDATGLAALQRMMVEAAARRPAASSLPNRVAAGFAAGVLLLAALSAAFWLETDPVRAVRAALAVLVVTCPCALSLAAPLAFAFAQARLAALGVLLARPTALEALARADVVAFDKTGTLTEDTPRLLAVEVLGALPRETCLAIAAAMEARSQHPFAIALRGAAAERALAPPIEVNAAEVPGMGIEARAAGRRYRLGKAAYALAIARDQAAAQTAAMLAAAGAAAGTAGASAVVLATEDGPAALFYFGERLRAGAGALLEGLAAQGRELLILSGDTPAAVARVARELGAGPGLRLAGYSGQSPADKRALLDARQRAGRRVAMIGDGINDAPVIAQADASIALASGATLAQVRADVVVVTATGLAPVGALFAMARRTQRVVRQNLLWAAAYNLLMVPLAAIGMLAPPLAAAGMSASAALVLANSARLRLAGRG